MHKAHLAFVAGLAGPCGSASCRQRPRRPRPPLVASSERCLRSASSRSSSASASGAPSALASRLCPSCDSIRRVLAQRDLVFTLEHPPAGFAARPTAVSRDIERNNARAVELAEDRTPFLQAIFLPTPKVGSLSWPNLTTASVASPIRISSDAPCRNARRCAGSPTSPSVPRPCRRSNRRRRRHRNRRRASTFSRNRRAGSGAGSAATRKGRAAR